MAKLVIEIDTARLPRAWSDALTAEEHQHLLDHLASLGEEYAEFAAAASAIYLKAIERAENGFVL